MTKKSLIKRLVLGALATTMAISATACKKDTSSNSNATNDSNKPKEIVQLKAFTMGKAPQSGLDNFYKQLDELTTKDLGATVRFDYIPWGDEKNKINLAIASNEYDLYIGGGFSDYKVMATKNAFYDLTPLLKEVPELVKHYSVVSDKTLSMHAIDGKLYGIPQFSKAGGYGGEGFLYREDLRKAWGLPEINSLETVEKYLYRAKQDAKYKDAALVTDQRIWTSLWYMIAGDKYICDFMNNEKPFAVVSYEDPYKVVSVVDTPEYKKVLEYAQKWYKDGIIDHDILAAKANETAKSAELIKADKKPAETNSPRWSIEGSIIAPTYKAHPEWEMGWYDYLYGKGTPFLPGVTNATAISINAKSKNPLVALKFIEKAHTNQKYYDLLRFGVLDENYKLVDGVPSTVGIDPNNVKPSWTGLPDGYMEKPAKSADPRWQADADKKEAAGKKATDYSPLEGFTFNTSELSAETAALETVRTQYMIPLQTGVSKDVNADLAKIKEKLKAAGLDKYISALQKQLDAFKAKKK
jgi:putative aldouronate transport system substrate-binding protein